MAFGVTRMLGCAQEPNLRILEASYAQPTGLFTREYLEAIACFQQVRNRHDENKGHRWNEPSAI